MLLPAGQVPRLAEGILVMAHDTDEDVALPVASATDDGDGVQLTVIGLRDGRVELTCPTPACDERLAQNSSPRRTSRAMTSRVMVDILLHLTAKGKMGSVHLTSVD